MKDKETTTLYNCKLQIRYKSDVLVIGGGTASIAVALAAFRQGDSRGGSQTAIQCSALTGNL